MRETQPIHSETKTGIGGDEERLDTHPAFGIATVTRGRSGDGVVLFQSDLQHHSTITLTIHEAERTRALNRDWTHTTKQVVEAEMSLAQWGELVSSIGLGTGVPVTIRRRAGEPPVPLIPHEPRLAESLDEVRDSVKELLQRSQDSLAELTEAIESKAGAKAVREALRKHQAALKNAPADAEFAVQSAARAAEKVTAQAKADLEAHALAAAQYAGLPELEAGS